MSTVIENFNKSEVITFIGTIAGLSGISLRDLNVKQCYKRMKEVFQDTFTEKEPLDDEKREIFIESLGELEKYLDKDENLDSKVFEELLKITINGVKLKEELTKEYIKILKTLSWLDLRILTEVSKIN